MILLGCAAPISTSTILDTRSSTLDTTLTVSLQATWRQSAVAFEDGDEREYSLPRGVHINVQEGEKVMAGDPLMDSPRNPHDILDVRGEKELQKYLVNEIQEVYRLQGVNINDKHLEVISRQK